MSPNTRDRPSAEVNDRASSSAPTRPRMAPRRNYAVTIVWLPKELRSPLERHKPRPLRGQGHVRSFDRNPHLRKTFCPRSFSPSKLKDLYATPRSTRSSRLHCLCPPFTEPRAPSAKPRLHAHRALVVIAIIGVLMALLAGKIQEGGAAASRPSAKQSQAGRHRDAASPEATKLPRQHPAAQLDLPASSRT